MLKVYKVVCFQVISLSSVVKNVIKQIIKPIRSLFVITYYVWRPRLNFPALFHTCLSWKKSLYWRWRIIRFSVTSRAEVLKIALPSDIRKYSKSWSSWEDSSFTSLWNSRNFSVCRRSLWTQTFRFCCRLPRLCKISIIRSSVSLSLSPTLLWTQLWLHGVPTCIQT